MQKKLIVAAVIALILLGGVIFVWQKKMSEVQPVSTSGLVEQPENKSQHQEAEAETFSPQHITPIVGSQQVWYEIPEMGIKLLLSREVAEELVYSYFPKVDGIMLYSTRIINYNKNCTELCGTIDENIEGLWKVSGTYNNENLEFGNKLLKQFPNFYLIVSNPSRVREPRFGSEEERNRFYQVTGNAPLLSLSLFKDIRIELLETK